MYFLGAALALCARCPLWITAPSSHTRKHRPGVKATGTLRSARTTQGLPSQSSTRVSQQDASGRKYLGLVCRWRASSRARATLWSRQLKRIWGYCTVPSTLTRGIQVPHTAHMYSRLRMYLRSIHTRNPYHERGRPVPCCTCITRRLCPARLLTAGNIGSPGSVPVQPWVCRLNGLINAIKGTLCATSVAFLQRGIRHVAIVHGF